MNKRSYPTITYMLVVLDHFRNLGAERRWCLYIVFSVVMGRVNKLLCDVPDLCSICTSLLAEILVNWDQGTKLSVAVKESK